MKDLIDNTEIERVLEKLEGLENEALAVEYLKKFNDATKEFGQLLLNQEQALDHEEWKKACDRAKKQVETIVEEIENL